MNQVQSTVEQLQKLIVNERQNRLKLESQLSTAQDQIGAAERRSQLLEQKNTRLEHDVDTGKNRLAQETVVNQQNVTSGSGVSPVEQTVPITSASGSMATPYIPHSVLNEPLEGPWLTGGEQRGRRVSFGSVFDASSGTGGVVPPPNGATQPRTGNETTVHKMEIKLQ